MGKFHVAEHFISINGEGRRAGQLAHFIRFVGCNLACEYCDTRWANEQNVHYETYGEEELYQMIKAAGVTNVTLTGGEPLLQKNIKQLLSLFRRDRTLWIEIETNGSVDILPFMPKQDDTGNPISADNVSFTLDYKLPVSGMEDRMCYSNYKNIREADTVKFVAGDRGDLIRSKEIIDHYELVKRGCSIYLSPCFGKIEPETMVNFLIEQRMNDINIQLQLHKYIWNPDQRGV